MFILFVIDIWFVCVSLVQFDEKGEEYYSMCYIKHLSNL